MPRMNAVMSDIHRLILEHGSERARELVCPKDRRLVDIAAEMLGEGTERLGISHAGFALTSLPHKEIKEPFWRREGYRVTLLVESGRDRNARIIGVPCGSKARLILLYLQTEAIRNNSREVELGPSMRSWMGAMGIATTGGMTYKLVTRQAQRIAACRLTFFARQGDLELRQNGTFVDSEISLFSNDDKQQQLWQESVTLNEHFFQQLKEHPVPLLESALRQISNSSLGIDVYIWLAYRLHSLRAPVSITWTAIHSQFGAGFKLIRQIKPTFTDALRLALTVYPEAQVDVDLKKGVTLYPSRPPVPLADHRRRLGVD